MNKKTCAFRRLPGLLLLLLLLLLVGGSPLFAQDDGDGSSDDAVVEEDGRSSELFAEFGAWVAQPVGLRFSNARLVDPLFPFESELLSDKYGTARRNRTQVGWSFKDYGQLRLTWFAHEDDAQFNQLNPGIYEFGQTLTFPVNAGFRDDGLSDGVSAGSEVKLRDFRLDYVRPAFENDRMRADWFVGVRRTFHRRTQQASYFSIVAEFPPLLAPIVTASRPDLRPNPDQAFMESEFNGRGAEAGLEFSVRLLKDRLTLEAGFGLAALRGTIDSEYRSSTWYYAIVDPNSGAVTPVAAPFTEFEQPIDPNDPNSPFFITQAQQLETRVGVVTNGLPTTALVIESHLGFRVKAWRGLEVSFGFRGTRYDDVGAEIRTGVPAVSVTGAQNLEATSRNDTSIGYEGYYLAVAYRY